MKIYHFLFLALFVFSCQQSPQKDFSSQSNSEVLHVDEDVAQVDQGDGLGFSKRKETSKLPSPTPIEHKVNTTPRRVIKNADYRIQVEDVDVSTHKIIAMAESYQGYLANMELVNTNQEVTNKMTLKVPAEQFEPFLNSVGEAAVLTAHKRVSSQDVTAEFVDLQARLKTKKEVKSRYEEILRKQTKTIAEVLDAEEKIRRLQEEIEVADGRLRLLANQSAMSTIHLEIFQPKEYEHQPIAYSESFWLKLWEGFENGWSGVTSIILVFVNAWPIVFLFSFVFWRRKKIFKRLYHRKEIA